MIDGFVSHQWDTIQDLAPYMEPGWRDVLTRNPSHPMRAGMLYVNPNARAAMREYDGEFQDGRRFEALRDLVLDVPDGPERVVLGYEAGLMAAAFANPYASLAIARAVNEWSVDRWLSQDDRLYGLALIPMSDPEAAAEEVQRVGENPRFVGLAIGPNVLGVPFGNAIYDPIYAAAEKADLPLVMHAKADGAATLAVPPTAGGLVATYGEYDVFAYQSIAAHICSMMAQGVFEIFPNLRVLIVGTGAAWLPAQLWRLDWATKYSPTDVTWMDTLPSRVFGDRFWLTTYGLEPTDPPARIAKLLDTMPWFARTLVYASGFPHSSSATPVADVLARFPEEWRAGITGGNALNLMRWPDQPRAEPVAPRLARRRMAAVTKHV